MREQGNKKYDSAGRPRLKRKILAGGLLICLRKDNTEKVEFHLGAHRRVEWLQK